MDGIVSRYAEALFLIAKEDNLIKEYQDEMNVIKDIFVENKEFLEILSSAFLSKEERKAIKKDKNLVLLFIETPIQSFPINHH